MYSLVGGFNPFANRVEKIFETTYPEVTICATSTDGFSTEVLTYFAKKTKPLQCKFGEGDFALQKGP